MLMSMTGFGRAFRDSSFGQVSVEILSINRRSLEVSISLPKEWFRYEIEVRRWVAATLNRGQVVVRVAVTPTPDSISAHLPGAALLKKLHEEWRKRADAAGIKGEIDLPFLVQTVPVASGMGDGQEILRPLVEEALKGLLEMRKAEGIALVSDLEERLKRIDGWIEEIVHRAPASVDKMRNRLRKRLQELVHEKSEEWISREAAVFAEKVDIEEEITRLKSHVQQMRDLFRAKGPSEGRKLEFLLQEMGREVNTLGSKSADERISRLVVELKTELDRMREQAANIE